MPPLEHLTDYLPLDSEPGLSKRINVRVLGLKKSIKVDVL